VGLSGCYDCQDFFSAKRVSLTTFHTFQYSGLQINGIVDVQIIQVNLLSVLGVEILNIGMSEFSHAASPKSYVDSRAPRG
jgi:hypothetical protein